VVTNTLKIMRATMLLSATSNGVGVNVGLVGYGLSVSRYQGIYNDDDNDDDDNDDDNEDDDDDDDDNNAAVAIAADGEDN
jgi:hypothetical protein